MSTQIANLQQRLPDELRKQFEDQVAQDLARLGATGGGDMIRVSQDKKFVLPDGSEIVGPLTVVILDFVYSNNYYIGAFNRKDIQPPACFAISPNAADLAPSTNSPQKQAESCSGCQHDQWGSSPTGDGKACKNNVLLSVIPPDATEDTEPLRIRLSPTAIKAFNKYVASVARAGVPLHGVVTELSFAEDVQYATLRFNIDGPNEGFALANSMRDGARHALMQEPDVSNFEAPKGKGR
jgi:hypothetical protein